MSIAPIAKGLMIRLGIPT
uniref:Uncharacterized protein n=1 Tax=Vitis vinifera TaxID=29760 RepID=F6I2B9_VITVI